MRTGVLPQPKPRPSALDRADRKRQQEREWDRLRAEARARDHYLCRVCGHYVTPGAIDPAHRAEVHHLQGRRVAPLRVRDMSNLVTVCALDHLRLTTHEIEATTTNQATVQFRRRR
jgi:5-methylcytosine-specific restriction endonuclease McrA